MSYEANPSPLPSPPCIDTIFRFYRIIFSLIKTNKGIKIIKNVAGSIYHGLVDRHGKANGQGTMTYVNGDKYEGQFTDDKANGHGTYLYANGDTYEGEFKDDEKHGQGTMMYANGNKYTGLWQRNKIVGITNRIVRW